MMHDLFFASAALAASLAPIGIVLVVWRRRMRATETRPAFPQEFGEWMHIEDKGPVIGHRGDQPIYQWIGVALSDGTRCRLGPDLPEDPPGFCFRMVRLCAGPVTYWGLASNDLKRRYPDPCPGSAGHQGFSLLELMIVVAMVAILLSIALPVYKAYVQQSAAKAIPAALLNLAQQVQQYAQDKNTYVGACSTTPLITNAQLTCPVLTASQYTVAAQGTGPIAGLEYTLTQSGTRATPSAPSGWPTSASCWVIDPSGTCAP